MNETMIVLFLRRNAVRISELEYSARELVISIILRVTGSDNWPRVTRYLVSWLARIEQRLGFQGSPNHTPLCDSTTAV